MNFGSLSRTTLCGDIPPAKTELTVHSVENVVRSSSGGGKKRRLSDPDYGEPWHIIVARMCHGPDRSWKLLMGHGPLLAMVAMVSLAIVAVTIHSILSQLVAIV